MQEGNRVRKKILIADDEPDIIELLRIFLESEQFELIEAHDGQAAWELIERHQVDLAVIDIMMPRMDGFQLIQQIRKACKMPIIILSARNEDVDKIKGLGIGADDYMTKPFNPLECVARIKAQLRRYYEFNDSGAGDADAVTSIGGLTLDHRACLLYKRGQPVALSATEYKLLKMFTDEPGRIFTKKQIFERVWGDTYIADDNTIMVQISRLRDKIEDNPRSPVYLKNIRGLGYRFAKREELDEQTK
jgi:DNA-binding response OmpR family regulator